MFHYTLKLVSQKIFIFYSRQGGLFYLSNSGYRNFLFFDESGGGLFFFSCSWGIFSCRNLGGLFFLSKSWVRSSWFFFTQAEKGYSFYQTFEIEILYFVHRGSYSFSRIPKTKNSFFFLVANEGYSFLQLLKVKFFILYRCQGGLFLF